MPVGKGSREPVCPLSWMEVGVMDPPVTLILESFLSCVKCQSVTV